MSKLHSSFLLIRELYFEPQLFEQQKNVSYKETFAKHWENEGGIVMLTES